MTDFRKLNKQPLQLVLLEVRFSNIMDVSKYIPAFQDNIRKAYPITGEPMISQSFRVSGQSLEVKNSQEWAFASKNRKSAVSIGESRFVLYTTEYPRFEGFADWVKDALNVVKEVMCPSLISRIGMRYCDLVKPEGNEELDKLVRKEMLPDLALNQFGHFVSHTTETVLENNDGTLIVKTLSGRNNLVLSPDFGSLPVKIEQDNEASLRAILDFDHFWQDNENQMDFDVEAVAQKMSAMHTHLRNAFWSVTSDYARNEKWN